MATEGRTAVTVRTAGRLAALLFLGSGLITLVALPLPGPSDLNKTAMLAVGAAAVVASLGARAAPGLMGRGSGAPAHRFCARVSLRGRPLSLPVRAARLRLHAERR